MDTGGQPLNTEGAGLSLAGFGARRSTFVLGAPGTGKTVFALQALVSAARDGKAGLFVGLGQSEEEIQALGRGFGWDLPGLQAGGWLAIQTCQALEHLASVVKDALPLAARLRANCLAVDSLHWAAFPGGVAEQMREMLQFRDSLFEQGLTAVVTCDPDHSGASLRCAALLQGLVDCTVRMECRPDCGGVRRSLRVLKYRAAPSPDWECPFTIGPGGIQLTAPGEAVAPEAVQPQLRAELDPVRKRFTTGLHALDRFLEMKQAELDFLLEKASEQGPGPGMNMPVSQPVPFRTGPQEIL